MIVIDILTIGDYKDILKLFSSLFLPYLLFLLRFFSEPDLPARQFNPPGLKKVFLVKEK